MDQSDTQYVSRGHVRDATDGSLSIVSVDESTIRVSDILFGVIGVHQKLDAGESHADILESLKDLQHLTQSFPVSALRRIRWTDFNHEVTFDYESDGRIKRANSFINSGDERNRLISILQKHFDSDFRDEQQAAGIVKVSWSYFFGAFLSVLLTAGLWLLWDPARLARVRGGWLFLALGKTACLLIGIGIVLVCLVCAWFVIRKRSMCYSCIIQD